MRQVILPLAALIIAVQPATAQRAGVTNLPDSVLARIDKAFLAASGAEGPGCAIGLARNGETVLTRAYGLANLEDGAANTPETIFESGSVAKQFTAASVILLALDGKLSLDDDIRKYLPEMHDFGKKISIRNLLTHTSGLRDWYMLADLEGAPAGRHVHSPASILEIASRQRTLNFEPGAEYLYSNTGYILASVIVQRVSGMPFAAFEKERIFKPLGMMHTEWREDFTKVVKGRATAYTGNARIGYTLDMPFTNVIGSGGLLTTVGDWLQWNAFLDNPAALPGGAALVQSMTKQMVLNSGKQIPYALGVSVTSREGMKEISHSGSTGGYRTWLARYPDAHASIAVMCNGGDGVNPTALAQVALLAALGRTATVAAAPVRVHVPVESLRRFDATFVGPTPEAIARFAVRDTMLVQVLPATRPLIPVGENRFRAGATEIAFVPRAAGVERMLLISNGDTTVYTPAPASLPTRSALAAYAGVYAGNELSGRIAVMARDSVLVLKMGPTDSLVVQPTIRDTFAGPGGTVQFARDGKGRVTSLGIWAGRVRNLRFTRLGR